MNASATEKQPEENSGTSEKPWLKLAVVSLLIFAIMYPLSLGPVLGLYDAGLNDYVGLDEVYSIYKPVLLILECTIGPDLYYRYLGWWCDHNTKLSFSIIWMIDLIERDPDYF